MKHRYLSFDIETAKVVPTEADLQAHRPLGITCYAVAWVGKDGEIEALSGCSADGDGNAARMTRDECAGLVNMLYHAVDVGGWTLLGHNIVGFDLDILAEESGLHAICAELALRCVDTCLHVHCVKGFPVGLDAICKGMGLAGKSDGMNGSLAPQMWHDGRYDEVLAYVAQDARASLEMAIAVERRGSLSWLAKSGRLNYLDIAQWLSVKEALALPLPDTAWMNEPIPRERFTAWMKTTEAA